VNRQQGYAWLQEFRQPAHHKPGQTYVMIHTASEVEQKYNNQLIKGTNLSARSTRKSE
jgi:hypothetical protein